MPSDSVDVLKSDFPDTQTGIDAVRYSLGMTSGVVGTGVFSFITLGQPQGLAVPVHNDMQREHQKCKECMNDEEKDGKSECATSDASRQ
eukprot:scaffold44048_cov26-Tisochrysis_lutea.AAC.1